MLKTYWWKCHLFLFFFSQSASKDTKVQLLTADKSQVLVVPCSLQSRQLMLGSDFLKYRSIKISTRTNPNSKHSQGVPVMAPCFHLFVTPTVPMPDASRVCECALEVEILLPGCVRPGEWKTEVGSCQTLTNIWKVGIKWIEARIFLVTEMGQWVQTGTWEISTNMKKISLLRGWQSTGIACPVRLWSPLLWRYLAPTWTLTRVTYREPAWAESWPRWPSEVPSKHYDFMIL